MRGSAFAPDAPLVAGACPPPPPVLPVLAMKLCLVEAGPLRTKLRETATLLPGLRVRGGGRYSGPRTDCSPFSHHQEIPRRFDMHQFMSTYKIQKCACRHFLFSAQVYVEIFFSAFRTARFMFQVEAVF